MQKPETEALARPTIFAVKPRSWSAFLVAIGCTAVAWAVRWAIGYVGPGVSPFPVPFVLNVTAGTRPLTLAEVRIQPTNPFGRTSPPTIFDSSSLTRQFGSLTVASFGVRQFPFTHPFTCDMRGTSLIVSVTMRDGTGMNRVSSSQVPVY